MNKISKEKINIDLIKIIGSYLLPTKQKINISELNNDIQCYENRLNYGYFHHETNKEKYIDKKYNIRYCEILQKWTLN